MKAPSGLAGGVRGWSLGETDCASPAPPPTETSRSRSWGAADTHTGDRGERGRDYVSDERGREPSLRCGRDRELGPDSQKERFTVVHPRCCSAPSSAAPCARTFATLQRRNRPRPQRHPPRLRTHARTQMINIGSDVYFPPHPPISPVLEKI